MKLIILNHKSYLGIKELEKYKKEIEKINEKETRKRISSPYTRKKVRKAKMKLVYFFSILTIILVSATLIFLNVFLSKKGLNYNIGSEITYEFTK